MMSHEKGGPMFCVAKDVRIKVRCHFAQFARWQRRAATDNRYQAPAFWSILSFEARNNLRCWAWLFFHDAAQLCLTGACGPPRYWPGLGRIDHWGKIKVFSAHDCSGPSVSRSIFNDEIAQRRNDKGKLYIHIYVWVQIVATECWN